MMTSLSLSGLTSVELTFEQLWADGSAQLSIQLSSPGSAGVELNLLFSANAEGLAAWWRTRQLAKAPRYWLMIESERVERQQAHMRTAEFYFKHLEKGEPQNVTQQVESDLATIRAGFAGAEGAVTERFSRDDGPNYGEAD